MALSGKLHGVKWFLEKGATVNSEDNRGWNTLHFAAQGGDADIISLILTHLPEIESKTAGGQTPLMIAVAFGKLPGIKYLLERGANPLAKDNDGKDSVYHALSRNPDFLDLLLSHVAKSKSTTSKSGWWSKLYSLIYVILTLESQSVNHWLLCPINFKVFVLTNWSIVASGGF